MIILCLYVEKKSNLISLCSAFPGLTETGLKIFLFYLIFFFLIQASQLVWANWISRSKKAKERHHWTAIELCFLWPPLLAPISFCAFTNHKMRCKTGQICQVDPTNKVNRAYQVCLGSLDKSGRWNKPGRSDRSGRAVLPLSSLQTSPLWFSAPGWKVWSNKWMKTAQFEPWRAPAGLSALRHFGSASLSCWQSHWHQRHLRKTERPLSALRLPTRLQLSLPTTAWLAD